MLFTLHFGLRYLYVPGMFSPTHALLYRVCNDPTRKSISLLPITYNPDPPIDENGYLQCSTKNISALPSDCRSLSRRPRTQSALLTLTVISHKERKKILTAKYHQRSCINFGGARRHHTGLYRTPANQPVCRKYCTTCARREHGTYVWTTCCLTYVSGWRAENTTHGEEGVPSVCSTPLPRPPHRLLYQPSCP